MGSLIYNSCQMHAVDVEGMHLLLVEVVSAWLTCYLRIYGL